MYGVSFVSRTSLPSALCIVCDRKTVKGLGRKGGLEFLFCLFPFLFPTLLPPSILSSLPPYSPLSLHTLHPSYVPSLSSRGIQHPLIPESWWKLRDRRRQWQLNLVTSWTTSETVCMLYVCATHTLLAHNHLILKFGYIGTTVGAPFVTTLGLKVNLCHQSKFVSCQCLRPAASTVIIGFQGMTCPLVMAIAP